MDKYVKINIESKEPLPSGRWVRRDSDSKIAMSSKLVGIAADPAKAAEFLKKAGFITASGKLTSHYK